MLDCFKLFMQFSFESEPTIKINKHSLLLNGALYNYFQLMKEYNLKNDSKCIKKATFF